jgi:hypothetical protein
MNEKVFLFFNWWGLIFLLMFSFGFGISHIFAVKGFSGLDSIARIVGFIALILVFLLSGWKAGLLALPIGFLISAAGAMLAKSLRTDI